MANNIRRAESIVRGGPRIVVIGGGTGISVILRGLKKISSNISAVVTMTDDGGASGVIRDELGILPPGDVRNCIMALADNEAIMESLFQYRFQEGRLEGQNVGNLVIAALADLYGDFEMAVNKLQEVLRIKGRVIPVTSDNAVLCARLEDGTVVKGESLIPEMVQKTGSPIEKVFLEPENTDALPAARRAIRDADLIILGPGSLFSSIIPNLLVRGIREAIRDASGMKLLICNVMTQSGETDNYSVSDFADAVEQYLGEGVLEYMLINDHICSSEEIAPYLATGCRQMLATKEDRNLLRSRGIVPIESNMIHTGDGVIRHDAERITNVVSSLVH